MKTSTLTNATQGSDPGVASTAVYALRAALVVALALLAGCGGDGPRVTAEFQTARGLVPGNHVRIAGAVAGEVESVELSDRGTARVELRLHDDAPELHADAAAAIRPEDLLGDTYVTLSPGTRGELRGSISVARTSSAPRLDELLRAFDAPVRTGLQTLLVEGGKALERRGEDLAQAAVELRPALVELDGVAGELSSQDAALRSLVADAERAVGALASRREDTTALVASLGRTLETTAGRSRELDRGLAGLPATLARARSTTRRLTTAATELRPVASDLGDAAPELASVARGLAPFLAELDGASTRLRPALVSLRRALVDGSPALRGLRDGLGALARISASVEALAAAVEPAAPAVAEGFFVNFADQAAEPGRQPFDPFADPRRNYWRGAAVMSCEAFGVRVEPGCLGKLMGASDRSARERGADRPPARTPRKPASLLPALTGGGGGASAPAAPATKPPPAATGVVGELLDGVEQQLTDVLDLLLKP